MHCACIVFETGSSHNGHGVVVEDSRDIFRGEFVCRVADEETCLADSTVTDDDTPAWGTWLAIGP